MIIMKDENNKILEDASNLCHIEWIDWTKNISKDLNESIQVLKNNIQYLKDDNVGIDKHQLIKENIELTNKLTEKLERWESLWIPYEELSEEMKEEDRTYARKILKLIE